MLSNKENDFKTRVVKISFQQLINKYLKNRVVDLEVSINNKRA